MEITSGDLQKLKKEVKDLNDMKERILKFCANLILKSLDKQTEEQIMNTKSIRFDFVLKFNNK